jgi:PAS domain S-box-containing protein
LAKVRAEKPSPFAQHPFNAAGTGCHQVVMNTNQHSSTASAQASSTAARLAAVFGAYVLIGGFISLTGWFANIPRLTDWDNDGISMMPNAAVCAVGAGTALALHALQRAGLLVRVLGLFVGLIGAATLFEYLTGIDLGIDTLLVYREWGQRGTVVPGRMGPPGSTSWTLIGLALALVSGGGRMRRAAVVCSLAAIGIATLSLVGYLFGASPLFTIPRLTTIALQTATMILAMGGGIVATMPDQQPMKTLLANTTAGLLARRALPFIILFPLLLGWLRVRGQEAGLFDTAFGTALRTLVEISFLVTLLWWALRTVTAKETALRREQERVRASEALLAAVLKQVPIGLGVIDTQGRWTLTNAVIDEYVPQGIPSTLPDCVSRWRAWDEHGQGVLPENWPGKRALRGEVAPGMEMIFTDDAGRERWMLVSAAPFRDAEGRIIGATCTIQDVDALKRAQEAALRSQEQLKLVSDTVPALISYVDEDCRYRMCNRAYMEWFDLPCEEIIGRPMREVLGGAAWQSIEPRIRAALAGETVDFETEAPYARGGTRWIHAIYTPHRDASGRVLGLVVMVSDVTARKQAETVIRESEERYRSLVSVITDVPWTTDANGAFVMPQPAWAAYTGQSWEEYRAFGWANALHPDDRSQVEEIWRRACKSRSLYESRGRLWHAASQQHRHFVARGTPILNDDGTVREWVGACTDVHEQKLAEKELAEAHALLADRARQLEKLVEKRTADLQETVQQLETFSYSIVHDMRAPLRSMRSFASILESDYRDKLDGTGHNYLGRIIASASRLDALITDVLSYSRVAMSPAQLQPVNLDRLLNEIVEQYPQFQEAASAIHVERPLPTVLGNDALLTQVFSNLLGNALKFVPPGQAPRVVVRAEETDGQARIWVEDNGIGIPAEHRGKLFGLFQRLQPPDKYGGTGVGLAIVRKAVERMGGGVGVESEPGRGSRFWFEMAVPKPGA